MRRLPIKFRMPPSARTWAKGSQWRELLMTIVATTISIILTFGTAAFLEHRQRIHDRKMSALMVISNIEKFTNELDRQVHSFAHQDSVATWILSLPIDSLDRIPAQEMMGPINEVFGFDLLAHDKTVENIFGNSIETWKNYGYFMFLDKVGECFSEMNTDEEYCNNWIKDFEQAINEVIEHPEDHPGERTHTKLLSDDVIRQKLENIHARQYWLEYARDHLRYMNKLNMQYIGITEKEVKEFAKNLEAKEDTNEPVVSDYRKNPLTYDSLTTIKSLDDHIRSIMRGEK